MAKLYYTPPSDEIFEEVRAAAIKIWQRYDHPDYVAEKVGRIAEIRNVGDNVMYIVAMFDHENRCALASVLSGEARAAIYERMVDGGEPDHLNPFND